MSVSPADVAGLIVGAGASFCAVFVTMWCSGRSVASPVVSVGGLPRVGEEVHHEFGVVVKLSVEVLSLSLAEVVRL